MASNSRQFSDKLEVTYPVRESLHTLHMERLRSKGKEGLAQGELGFSLTEILVVLGIIAFLGFGWRQYQKRRATHPAPFENGSMLALSPLQTVPSKWDDKIKTILPNLQVPRVASDGGFALGSNLAKVLGQQPPFGAFVLSKSHAKGTTGQIIDRATVLGYLVLALPKRQLADDQKAHYRMYYQGCDFAVFAPNGTSQIIRAPAGHALGQIGVNKALEGLTGSAIVYRSYSLEEMERAQKEKRPPHKRGEMAIPRFVFTLNGTDGPLLGEIKVERCRMQKGGTFVSSPTPCFTGALKTSAGKPVHFGYAYSKDGYEQIGDAETLNGAPIYWFH